MNIKKKFVVFFLVLISIFSCIPTIGVQAKSIEFKIISDSKVTENQAKKWAKSKGATQDFIDLAEYYFDYSSKHGNVNPAIAYVQAAKETEYGKYDDVLKESYNNPGGLRKDVKKNTFQEFDSLKKGVQAHLDHLALLAGVQGYPDENSYDQIQSSKIKGKAVTVNDLSGNWTASDTYGEKISDLYKDLLEFSGVNYSKDDNGSVNDEPNPGQPESKPSALNVSEYKTQRETKGEDAKPNITSTIGWRLENYDWYYYKSDKTKATGWIKPDSNWYYLYSDGKMATGWIKDSGIWYYLDNSGSMAKGWRKVNGLWYYLSDSGAMITGPSKIDGSIYLLENSGAMDIGWVKYNNHWYYFNGDGSMAIGWIIDNGKTYYLYDTGAMAAGWLKISGAWYYFDNSGARTVGWVNSGSDYYYLDPSNGMMLTNTKIDGYTIKSNGKRVASKDSTNTNSNKSIENRYYKGIDISNYDGDIDFAKVKSDGIECVYIKATEGTTFVDNYLNNNYKGAKNAGLKTGFYHFLVGTSLPETQAENFYNNIKGKENNLKPCLDIETANFDVMDYTLRFIKRFKELSNMDICVYTYSNFISNFDNRLSNYDFWEANYNNSPFNLPTNSIWSRRVGHQYTDKGRVNGISCDVDLDDFTQDIFR